MLAGMDEGGGFPIDLMMLICAAIGVGRAFERLWPRAPESPDWLRLACVAVIAGNAYQPAEHWRHALYGLLMPLGAYYLAGALAAPLARWRAERRAAD
jgi:hypothetical protein